MNPSGNEDQTALRWNIVRDKVGVFYYPSMFAEHATLKKAILLFDEIHFIDRPSFMFGNFGTVGCASPMRQVEQSFRDEEVPVYVHEPNDGPVVGEFLEQVKSDVNDMEFLRRFQKGLGDSLVFRDQQIAPGNYGEVGSHEAVAQALLSVNLDADFAEHPTPVDLFYDNKIQPFRFKTPTERAKSLVSHATTCSAMVNFALNASQHQAITPLADSVVYQQLLGAKYARAAAASALVKIGSKIQLTDLSFAILDELVPAERLEQLEFIDVVKYRKESAAAREAFLEHLSALHAKQGAVDDGNYGGAISKIVNTEIIPEARKFKNAMDHVYSKLFGNLAKTAVGYLGSGAALQIFGDVSWTRLLQLAGLAGAAIGGAAIDAKLEVRSARHDCAISYVLGLDK
jgi:hypothetical protein